MQAEHVRTEEEEVPETVHLAQPDGQALITFGVAIVSIQNPVDSVHLSGVIPTQASHPSGHLVIAAVSMKYLASATKQSAKVLPMQTMQLETQVAMFVITVELEKVTVDGKYFPQPFLGTQSNKVADLHESQISMLQHGLHF